MRRHTPVCALGGIINSVGVFVQLGDLGLTEGGRNFLLEVCCLLGTQLRTTIFVFWREGRTGMIPYLPNINKKSKVGAVQRVH